MPRYAALPEVDRVVGNAEKLRPETWRRGANERVAVGDLRDAPAPEALSNAPARTRAFLTIQQGCDHACSFCVIPQGRGANRSVPAAALLAAARRLVAGGCCEILLTGVDIASWGRDLPGDRRLGDLVTLLLEGVPDLPRLRLSTLDPAALDEGLLRAFAWKPRLMPQLHLSVQAGDDLILKRMKRRHLRADVIAAARRLRAARPDMVLGADLIAGFPTESEAQAQRTLELVHAPEQLSCVLFRYRRQQQAGAEGHAATRDDQLNTLIRDDLFRRGVARFQAADYAGAVADFERVAAGRPDYPGVRQNLNAARSRLQGLNAGGG